MKIVGANIKRVREEKGITLRELAKQLDVSASFLSQVETGKAFPSLSSLKNLANSLQVTVGGLMGEDSKITDPVVKKNQRKALKQMGKGEKIPTLNIDVGEMVRIIIGPFTGYSGKVREIDQEKAKLKIFISIFGRETSVELDFNDVEKY